MEQRSVNITGVPETMLQTVYARAKATRQEPRYINDQKAVEIVEQLDYDFSMADRDRMMSSGVLARTILLDRMVGEWLNRHPGAVVVNLACGLDTRCCRMEGKYSRWYNLDLPETMAVRKRFFAETDRVKHITCSAADEAWAARVEQREEPVLVIIEGLTMYLREKEVQQIFAIIHRRFAHVQVIAEVMSPWVVGHVKEKSIQGSQAKFTWGVSDGKALAALVPPFRSVKDVSLVEGMAVFMPVYRLLRHIGFLRRFSNQLMVLEA